VNGEAWAVKLAAVQALARRVEPRAVQAAAPACVRCHRASCPRAAGVCGAGGRADPAPGCQCCVM
jgi:hypothetical protein